MVTCGATCGDGGDDGGSGVGELVFFICLCVYLSVLVVEVSEYMIKHSGITVESYQTLISPSH